MDEPTREQMVQEHLDAIRELQGSSAAFAGGEGGDGAANTWPPEGYYLLWHIVVGMMLGFIGAAVSLVMNLVGAPLFGEEPFQLIRVYLTFPMGEAALTAEAGAVLATGCILYLVTGGLYGVVYHLIMSVYFGGAGLGKRFAVSSAIGLGLWIVNFYLVLSWLQPVLLGGAWIVESVPILVGALTHLAFAWTMLAVSAWGRFVPYRRA